MKFSIKKESYWYSNGCDCCDPIEMEYYVPYLEDGSVVASNGTCHSEAEAKAAILEFMEYTGIVEINCENC